MAIPSIGVPQIDLELKYYINKDILDDNTATVTQLIMFITDYLFAYETTTFEAIIYKALPKLLTQVNAREATWIGNFFNTYVYNGNTHTIEPIAALLFKCVLETLLVTKYIPLEGGYYDYEIPILPNNIILRPNNFYLRNFETRLLNYVYKYYYHNSVMFTGSAFIILNTGCGDPSNPKVISGTLIDWLNGNTAGHSYSKTSTKNGSIINLPI